VNDLRLPCGLIESASQCKGEDVRRRASSLCYLVMVQSNVATQGLTPEARRAMQRHHFLSALRVSDFLWLLTMREAVECEGRW